MQEGTEGLLANIYQNRVETRTCDVVESLCKTRVRTVVPGWCGADGLITWSGSEPTAASSSSFSRTAVLTKIRRVHPLVFCLFEGSDNSALAWLFKCNSYMIIK